MDDPQHGVRRTYQHGCRCAACTTVNTAYSAQYRQAARAGRPPLGAHVAGTEAARVIAALVAEGYRTGQIGAWLGHRRQLHWRRGAGVTVRTMLRLRAIQRRIWEKGA